MIRGVQINDDNAESVGTLYLEQILQSIENANHNQIIENFPYLKDLMTT